jgi:hypothetical protein
MYIASFLVFAPSHPPKAESPTRIESRKQQHKRTKYRVHAPLRVWKKQSKGGGPRHHSCDNCDNKQQQTRNANKNNPVVRLKVVVVAAPPATASAFVELSRHPALPPCAPACRWPVCFGVCFCNTPQQQQQQQQQQRSTHENHTPQQTTYRHPYTSCCVLPCLHALRAVVGVKKIGSTERDGNHHHTQHRSWLYIISTNRQLLPTTHTLHTPPTHTQAQTQTDTHTQTRAQHTARRNDESREKLNKQ